MAGQQVPAAAGKLRGREARTRSRTRPDKGQEEREDEAGAGAVRDHGPGVYPAHRASLTSLHR